MLSRFSVKRPYTVLVGVVLVLILGYVSFTKMTTDLLPSINMPYAIVITTYPGASPEEVEKVVTSPVESSMATTSNIKEIRSVSSENVSVVILEFEQTANMDSVTIEMRESLDQISAYWDDSISSPVIMKLNPDMMPIMVAAIAQEDVSNSEITRLVLDEIVPELESIEGVASVSTTGDIEENVHVIIRQEKIDALNEKITASLDSKFADAKKEMDNAKNELASGKEKLKEGQNELNNKTLDAEMKIQDGQLDMASGSAVLEVKLSEIEKNEKELLENQEKVNSTLTTLNNAKSELESAKELLNKKAELEATIQQLNAGILAIDNNPGLSAEQKAEQKAPLQAALAQANTGLTVVNQAITKASEAMGETLTISLIDEKLSEVNAGITEAEAGKNTILAGIEAVKQGKEALLKAKADMESGKTSVNDTIKQLNEGKLVAQSEINEGLSAIIYGEQQLNNAEEEFDKSKETAYENATAEKFVTKDTLEKILYAQNFSMPAGYITEGGVSYLVRVGDEVEDTAELEDLVLMDLNMDGIDPIKLSDVADVIVIDNADEIYAKLNGENGIMLTIEKQTGYSTGEVTDRINEKFDSLMEKNEGLSITALMDQGVYIDLIVNSVLNNMIMGGLLAIVILFIFLKDFKPTIVIACSIPISIITAIVLMYFSGVTINVISLSGLALGVGMLVDNSIVVIENIYRLRNEGEPIKRAAVEGAKQVAGAITVSTLTTICVFLPIVFTEGITRQLFVEMGLTIAYSLLASLLIALTFVPMMGAGLLKNVKEKKHGLTDKIQNIYGNVLRKVLKLKALVIILVVVLLGLSAVAAASRGTAFMPNMESTQATVTLTTDKEFELSDTAKVADEAMERILEIPDVENVGAMIGNSGAMSMSTTSNTNEVSMYLLLKEDKELSGAELEKEILDKTKDLDCEVNVSTSTMDMSALGGSGISIVIKGHDTDELQRISKEVAGLIEDVEGTKNVNNGIGETTPELRISIDKAKAAANNLTVAQVFAGINEKIAASKKSTTLTTNGREYEVFVENESDEELDRAGIKEIEIEATDKEGNTSKVKLNDIATFEDANGLTSINRQGQQRYLTVSAEIDSDHNIGLVSNDIQKILDDYDTPEGYSIKMAGETETINEAMEQLVLMLLLAVAFIYLIMVAQFQSLLSPFIIMFTIPLAFTGGLFALFITNSEISVIAMIGFVMLSGIIVNNGIVLVDYINQLRRAGMDKKEAIVEAGKTRLRPIFMTALTTILGLSTMALGAGMGSDMVQPMAIVTIGGLIYGTLLTLFVIPCIYDLFNRNKSMVEEEI